MGLIFNILPYYVSSDFISYTPDKISLTPEFPRPQLFPQFGKLLKCLTGRHTFQYLYHLCRGISRRCLNKYVHVVFHNFHRIYPELILLGYPLKHLFQVLGNFPTQDVLPILRYPHQMVLNIKNGVLCPSNSHTVVIQGKALLRQVPLPRLAASRFPPASKLTGIQRSFL